MKRRIYTGTSGWMYKHWKGTFYPEKLKENQLVFYSREFKTVELNFSFYRMPDPKAYDTWYAVTPADFTFSIKMNRYLTHLKRLIIDEESAGSLRSFLVNTQGLKEKLAVILIQLHPRQEADAKRLDLFLSEYNKIIKDLEYKPSTCIEFRNISWFSEEIYGLLKKHNVALVFPNTPEMRRLVFPSDFAYIRIHGSNSMSDEELKGLLNEIQAYPAVIKRVFIYFNNDWNTYAIYNARSFLSMNE